MRLRFYEVFIAFADHYDTNWVVMTNSKASAKKLSRQAAASDRGVCQDLKHYGYDPKHPTTVMVTATTAEGLQGDQDVDPNKLKAHVPVLIDCGT